VNRRIGVIGAGLMGLTHVRLLSGAVSGAEVVAVADAVPEAAERAAAEAGIEAAHADAAALIDDERVEAVVVASPAGTHEAFVLACLEAGKPVLCEKPLAETVDAARRVLEAELASGRRLVQVGFMRRFDPGYVELRSELGPAGIGDPLMVHNVHRNTVAPYGLRTEETLTNMVVHEFDATRWLLGEELVSVLVLAGKPGPHTPAGERDPILVVLESESGVLVEVEAFRHDQFGYEVTCRVTGSHGQAVMGDGSWVTRSKDFSRGVAIPELWLGRFDEAYRRQLQHWVDALRTGSDLPGASAWDGYAASVIAHRAIDSYRSGQRMAIDLPERPGLYS
jgi:myo-inositol 2-dehydrogenase/D-chiro-inositol 1-dehydrogenase